AHIKDFVEPLKNLIKFEWPKDVWANLPGWLASVFAITLGAPFWFDVLSKAANLRASGKKESKESK
ncbi:MAG: hypothetical protein KJO77_03540, partial [Bacteroidia bacterium]|nr:hypothetical protein [Bacteroidia bacterium]